MYLLEDYSFFSTLIERVDFTCELPVSANFLGNFWRLGALYALRSDTDLFRVHEWLTLAEKHFTQSPWGLGLTYSMLGKLYSISVQNQENIQTAQLYYKRSIESFMKIDHYRGVYTAVRNLCLL